MLIMHVNVASLYQQFDECLLNEWKKETMTCMTPIKWYEEGQPYGQTLPKRLHFSTQVKYLSCVEG